MSNSTLHMRIKFVQFSDSLIGVKTSEAKLEFTLTGVNGMGNNPVASEAILKDAARSSELVLTAGYQTGGVLARVAPEFPNVQFVIFDIVLDIANVASVNYKANEGHALWESSRLKIRKP